MNYLFESRPKQDPYIINDDTFLNYLCTMGSSFTHLYHFLFLKSVMNWGHFAPDLTMVWSNVIVSIWWNLISPLVPQNESDETSLPSSPP